jgi:flagellar hook protein FlgE
LIGLWDLQDFLLIKTLGYNDAKVMALSLNFDGTLIASLQEDDLNKKYQIEIYDFDYENPSAIGSTVFSYTTNHEK